MGYASGYGIALMSWVQLFYICELGECVQVRIISRSIVAYVAVQSTFVKSALTEINGEIVPWNIWNEYKRSCKNVIFNRKSRENFTQFSGKYDGFTGFSIYFCHWMYPYVNHLLIVGTILCSSAESLWWTEF